MEKNKRRQEKEQPNRLFKSPCHHHEGRALRDNKVWMDTVIDTIHVLENITVLPCYPITSQWSKYSVALSQCSSSLLVTIRMFHCLFIVLTISLFSMSSSHDPVVRMFNCLFIVLTISLFSMSSSHDPEVVVHIIFKISLIYIPSHDPVVRMFNCLFTVLKTSHGSYG